jgi:hypothetical protein
MWPSNIECASLDHRSRTHAAQVCKEVLARLTFKAHENAYCCNKDDLIRLGQRFDPKLRDPSAALQRGSEQFKVSFDNLRKAFTESSWARENILIAIAGSETDGTSGVRDGADATLRQETEKFAHIIFASSAAQRDFWLGRRNLSFPKIISGRNGGAARTRLGDLVNFLSEIHALHRTAAEPDVKRRLQSEEKQHVLDLAARQITSADALRSIASEAPSPPPIRCLQSNP